MPSLESPRFLSHVSQVLKDGGECCKLPNAVVGPKLHNSVASISASINTAKCSPLAEAGSVLPVFHWCSLKSAILQQTDPAQWLSHGFDQPIPKPPDKGGSTRCLYDVVNPLFILSAVECPPELSDGPMLPIEVVSR